MISGVPNSMKTIFEGELHAACSVVGVRTEGITRDCSSQVRKTVASARQSVARAPWLLR